jgi:uncharacterized protein (DUF433 family)
MITTRAINPEKLYSRLTTGLLVRLAAGGSLLDYNVGLGVEVTNYVEQRNGGYYVAGTRVSLDSVVYEFRRGSAPESILRSFHLISSLERVYGAITFYLANQQEVDRYLECQQELWEKLRAENPIPEELKTRLEQARLAMPQR